MKKTLLTTTMLAVPWLSVLPVLAADDTTLQLERPPEQLNQFSLGYRMGLNISARFNGVGSIVVPGHAVLGAGNQPGNPGPPSGANSNRTYQDGYNWVDSTGNAFGLTSYWGYDRSSQVQNNSIVMHSATSSGVSTSGREDDPMPGAELTYTRQFLSHNKWHGGLEAAFGYTRFDLQDNQTLNGSADQIADAFALPPVPGGGLVVPPPPPYQGPYTLSPNGNPLLSASPNRTETMTTTSISGQRRFEADLYGLRIGPYLNYPLSRRIKLGLSGGFTVFYASSDFRFTEATAVPGMTSVYASGSSSHSDWLPGGYVAGTCSVILTQKWGLFANAQWQDLGQYTHDLGGRQAILDLRNAVFVAFGASYSF